MRRTNPYYSKLIYGRCFYMFLRHKWLRKNQIGESFLTLINSCENAEQIELMFDLTDHFTYVWHDQYYLLVEDAAKYIVAKSENESKPVILASSIDVHPDSGEIVLSDMKVFLKRMGQDSKFFLLNRVVSKDGNRETKDASIIFVVDEFAGSGKTMKSRYQKIREVNKTAPVIFVYLSGIISNIADVASELQCEYHCGMQLRKGISENNDEAKSASLLQTMLEYESHRLASQVGDKLLTDHSMGYGKAEALYARENGNEPNSVFPAFWWDLDNENKERNPMFIRSEK